MAFPPGVWTMEVFGQYLRPDGKPQRGYITITPIPAAVGQTAGDSVRGAVVTQGARIDIAADGRVRATLLNPNDPKLSPGDVTDGDTVRRWSYVVEETFYRGSVLQWILDVPDTVGDRETVDLSRTVRRNERIVRPADWFPGHYVNPLPR